MRPVLVTGTHRSGTTWTGKTIAQAPSLMYIAETFSPNNDWTPTTIQPKPFHYWYTYIRAGNEHEYESYVRAAMGLDFQLGKEIASIRSARDIARIGKRVLRHPANQARGIAPLMREPVALLSAEWMAAKFDMQNVVMLRHPAAFVESILRLDWQFDYSNLTEQDGLVAKFFPEHEATLKDYAAKRPEPLESAVFQWNIYHHVIKTYMKEHPDWIYVRLEDLSLHPVEEFKKLFEKLGLDFTPAIQHYVEDSTGASNPVKTDTPFATKRDSKATVVKWKKTLTQEQIAYIRKEVEPLASDMYADEDW